MSLFRILKTNSNKYPFFWEGGSDVRDSYSESLTISVTTLNGKMLFMQIPSFIFVLPTELEYNSFEFYFFIEVRRKP